MTERGKNGLLDFIFIAMILVSSLVFFTFGFTNNAFCLSVFSLQYVRYRTYLGELTPPVQEICFPTVGWRSAIVGPAHSPVAEEEAPVWRRVF